MISDDIDLYLLRHGETQWNREKRVQGRMNSPLTTLGKQQALAQRQILLELGGNVRPCVLCSPTGRAKETAEVINHNHEFTVQFDPRLVEISVGDWEGLTLEEIERRDPNQLISTHTFLSLYSVAPNGEGLCRLKARCMTVLRAITTSSIIISHGVTLTVLRGILLKLDDSEMEKWSQEQGTVTHIRAGKERVLRCSNL